MAYTSDECVWVKVCRTDIVFRSIFHRQKLCDSLSETPYPYKLVVKNPDYDIYAFLLPKHFVCWALTESISYAYRYKVLYDPLLGIYYTAQMVFPDESAYHSIDPNTCVEFEPIPK